MRISNRAPIPNIIYIKGPPIIQYVYVMAPAPPPPPRMARYAQTIETNILNTKDPAKLKKLKELSALLQTVLQKIRTIESSGIRDMLNAMVDKAMNAMMQGNLDVAVDIMAATNDLADKCIAQIEKIRNNIHLLRTLDVKGPAAAMCKAIADAAQLALNAASSLEDLETLGNLTDKAVAVAKQMVGLKPGSREYMELFGTLQGILAEVLAMKQAGYKPDDSAIGGESTGDRIQRHVADMVGNAKGPEDKGKLLGLQDALLELQAMGAGLPNQGALEQAINDALNQAQNGQLDEASTAARKLLTETKQRRAMDAHCDKRLQRLNGELSQVEGPANQLGQQTMAKLQAMRDQCATPEDYHRVDAMIERALKCCAAGQQDGSVRGACYQGLLKLNKELSSLAPTDEQKPSFGTDTYGSPGASSPGGASPGAPSSSPGASSSSPDGPASPGDAPNFDGQLAQLRQIGDHCSGSSADAVYLLVEVAAFQCAHTHKGNEINLLRATLSSICEGAQKLPGLSPGSPEFDDAIGRLRAKLASACSAPNAKKEHKHHHHHTDRLQPLEVVIEAIVIPAVPVHHDQCEPSPGAEPAKVATAVAPKQAASSDSGEASPGK